MPKKIGSRPSAKQNGKETKAAGTTPRPDVQAVRILWETEPAAVYSDFASIGVRQPGDFSVTLCALSASEATPGPDGKLTGSARIVASVRMNPNSFLALAVLMMNQWNNFIETSGMDKALKFSGFGTGSSALKTKEK